MFFFQSSPLSISRHFLSCVPFSFLSKLVTLNESCSGFALLNYPSFNSCISTSCTNQELDALKQRQALRRQKADQAASASSASTGGGGGAAAFAPSTRYGSSNSVSSSRSSNSVHRSSVHSRAFSVDRVHEVGVGAAASSEFDGDNELPPYLAFRSSDALLNRR